MVLIDEIDKLGQGHQGDPASALLEVLDPSQNTSFLDHYLDEPVDISKVLFMCTANELERISEPLLDRMEVIRLSGYDFPEKVAIGEQYLVPKSMRDNGLLVEKIDTEVEEEKIDGDDSDESEQVDGDDSKKSAQVDGGDDSKKPEQVDSDDSKISEQVDNTKIPVEMTTPLGTFVIPENIPPTIGIAKDAIESLVRWYAREAGVRNLSKYIDKITRKLALQVVAEGEGTELTKKSTRKSDSWTVTEDNLKDYVGKHIYTSDRLYDKDPLPDGIVMG